MSTDDDELLTRLSAALDAAVPDVTADRVAQIRAAAQRQRRLQVVAPRDGGRTRRAVLLASAAAAVGAVGGAIAVAATDDDETPVAGPPTEALSFDDGPAAVAGTSITGKVINHTWGVELLLDATGFAVGSKYRIVYIDAAEGTVEAGGFLGSAVPIHCRCNAPLLRDDITAIEIREESDALVATARFG